MKDEDKTKEQLLRELEKLRQQVAEKELNPATPKLLDSFEESIAVVDRGLHFLLLNNKAARLLGVTKEDILGKTIKEVFSSEAGESMSSNVQKVFHEGKSLRTERLFIFSDEATWMETLLVPIKNDSEDVDQVLVVSRDITERKQIEKALEESKERWRAEYQNSPVRTASWKKVGDDFVFSDYNKEAFRSSEGKIVNNLGIKVKDLSGKWPGFVDNMYRCYNEKKTITKEIHDASFPTGEANKYIISSFIYVPPDTVTVHHIDLTERIKLEKELRQSQKMEALGTLAGGISHDFNNLLVPILGLAEMVKIKLPPESPHIHHLEMIIESARRAKDLVSQILVVARQAESKPRPLQLREIVEETLKLLRATLPTSIAFQKEIDPDLPQVSADPSHLHQVIMNLCVNASQAMPDGGILTIGLKHIDPYPFINTQGEQREGDFVCLKVRDTGSGIDEKLLERIFEPFFTTKELGSEKGTGLGLAMVAGIVEQHGGQIEVESKRGQGTSISIYFPVAKIPQKEPLFKETDHLKQGEGHVLMIEDEKIVLDTGVVLLENMGYQVTGFSDSQRALEAFETNPIDFDLVITDYMMPIMNGVQLVEKLRAIRPEIPVILCTGYADLPTNENLKKWNFDDAIIKPYDHNKMNQTLHKALEKVKS